MSVEFNYHPERTVPGRKGPSVIARFIGEGFANKAGATSILDYGCGKGGDISYYNNLGFKAVGYDPFPAFGYSDFPQGSFDLTSVAFVLNVIPDTETRVDVLAKVFNLTKPGGTVILTTRSYRGVEREAYKKNWERHKDGYWSSKTRGMFQKGIDNPELTALAAIVGLIPQPIYNQIKLNSHSSTLLLTRP